MNFDLLFESYMSCLLLEARDKDYLQKLEAKGFDNAQEITDTLVSWDNPKKEKTALHFILNRSMDLNKDLDKFEKAYVLIDRQHLDFNKFISLDEILGRSDASTERILSKTSYDPDKEPCFSNKKDLGKGTIVYTVEDSKEGQKAARKALDLAGYGPSFNGWCLLARKSKFSQRQLDEFARLSPEQLEKLGYYDEDDLNVAWNCWKTYSAYPKRVAFKNGKLVSFSAGGWAGDYKEDHVKWWDRENNSHDDEEIPYCNVTDDLDFLMKYEKTKVAKSQKASAEVLKKLAEDGNNDVRLYVARNPKTPAEVLKKLAEDKNENDDIRKAVARNQNAPIEVLVKMAEDENEDIRSSVARNPSTPAETLVKLTEDEDGFVKIKAAENPNTPVEVLVKMAEDSNAKLGVAGNPSTPLELIKKMSEDENVFVRYFVAKNPKIPAELLVKLSEDKESFVKEAVAENTNTPVEILVKLAKNENNQVRQKASENLRNREHGI